MAPEGAVTHKTGFCVGTGGGATALPQVPYLGGTDAPPIKQPKKVFKTELPNQRVPNWLDTMRHDVEREQADKETAATADRSGSEAEPQQYAATEERSVEMQEFDGMPLVRLVSKEVAAAGSAQPPAAAEPAPQPEPEPEPASDTPEETPEETPEDTPDDTPDETPEESEALSPVPEAAAAVAPEPEPEQIEMFLKLPRVKVLPSQPCLILTMLARAPHTK